MGQRQNEELDTATDDLSVHRPLRTALRYGET